MVLLLILENVSSCQQCRKSSKQRRFHTETLKLSFKLTQSIFHHPIEIKPRIKFFNQSFKDELIVNLSFESN